MNTHSPLRTARTVLLGIGLLLLGLTWSTSAMAEVCWGKVCTGAVCCGGNGKCTGFNTCQCDQGWVGKECESATYCGVTSCSAACGGNGVCRSAAFVASGTCTGASGFTLSCVPISSGSPNAVCTLTTGSVGSGYACTLNNVAGTLTGGVTAGSYYWYPTTPPGGITAGGGGSCGCNPGYTGSCCQTLSASLLAAAIDFGAQPVGSATAGRAVSFANPLEDAVATVDGIALSGANPGDFTVGGSCTVGASVAAAGSCTVDVAFAPTATGSRSATLTVTVSSATTTGTPTVVNASLAGTGTVSADSIVVDPSTPTTLYAGLDGAGVFYSTNAGASWTAATVQPGNLRVKALALKSGTPLYAATYGGGVFKSSNGGVGWAACASQPASLNARSLTLDAAGTLYAGTDAGVFVSTDACASWAAMNTGLPN